MFPEIRCVRWPAADVAALVGLEAEHPQKEAQDACSAPLTFIEGADNVNRFI